VHIVPPDPVEPTCPDRVEAEPDATEPDAFGELRQIEPLETATVVRFPDCW
jgi:hypothetical protein